MEQTKFVYSVGVKFGQPARKCFRIGQGIAGQGVALSHQNLISRTRRFFQNTGVGQQAQNSFQQPRVLGNDSHFFGQLLRLNGCAGPPAPAQPFQGGQGVGAG